MVLSCSALATTLYLVGYAISSGLVTFSASDVLLGASHYAISSGHVSFSASDVLLGASHYAISSGLVSFSASRQKVIDLSYCIRV